MKYQNMNDVPLPKTDTKKDHKIAHLPDNYDRQKFKMTISAVKCTENPQPPHPLKWAQAFSNKKHQQCKQLGNIEKTSPKNMQYTFFAQLMETVKICLGKTKNKTQKSNDKNFLPYLGLDCVKIVELHAVIGGGGKAGRLVVLLLYCLSVCYLFDI